MTNFEVRQAISAAMVKHWQVADKLGICPEHFSRMLRYEVSEEKKNEILAAVNEIVGNK